MSCGAGEKLIQLDHASIRHSKEYDIALVSLSDALCAQFSPSKRFTRLSARSSRRCSRSRASGRSDRGTRIGRPLTASRR
jgi:hypothetical protein